MNTRKRLLRPGIIFLIGFFIYFSYVLVDQQKLLNARLQDIKNLKSNIAVETELNKQLEGEIEMLDSDEYIEKIAREKLGMVKDNEKVFIDVNR
jgi:cell division protein FtsB